MRTNIFRAICNSGICSCTAKADLICPLDVHARWARFSRYKLDRREIKPCLCMGSDKFCKGHDGLRDAEQGLAAGGDWLPQRTLSRYGRVLPLLALDVLQSRRVS